MIVNVQLNDSRPDSAVLASHSSGALSTDQGFDDLYLELHRLAKSRMARGAPDRLLQTTGLVHEVYLRLQESSESSCWTNRSHFFAAASEAMRRVLVDRARTAKCLKRGGHIRILPLHSGVDLSDRGNEADGLWDHMDLAISELEREDPTVAQMVKMIVFCGLSVTEAGALLELSRSTAYEYWQFARRWFQIWDKSDGSGA